MNFNPPMTTQISLAAVRAAFPKPMAIERKRWAILLFSIEYGPDEV